MKRKKYRIWYIILPKQNQCYEKVKKKTQEFSAILEAASSDKMSLNATYKRKYSKSVSGCTKSVFFFQTEIMNKLAGS